MLFRSENADDVDEIVEVEAHRAIIYARCKYLHDLISESTNVVERESDSVLSSTTKVIVDIDDCNVAVFNAYLHFLYSGELELSSVSNIQSLSALVAKWCPDTHRAVIQEICNPTGQVKLTLAEEVIAQMERDFETLINNPESYSDVSLMVGDGSDDSCLIPTHRFILCRSPYFRNMLGSGMQESFSDVITLQDYDRDVMMEILRYCYSDKINLNFTNAVGSLIYSSLFQLPDIANSCRNLVGQCLTLGNICAVTDIAEAYNDSALKRICFAYLRDNYDEIQHATSYLSLSTDTRSKVEEMYQKKKRQASNKK